MYIYCHKVNQSLFEIEGVFENKARRRRHVEFLDEKKTDEYVKDLLC